jgi:transcriptional regulator GlxA family with amidase domain
MIRSPRFTARYLIVDTRVAQSAYAILDHLAHADPLVQRFEHWAREHLADGFSLDEAAQAVATSERTLARRIGEVLGRTPLSYFQDLRVERGVHLLRTSSDDVETIAASVGYADGVGRSGRGLAAGRTAAIDQFCCKSRCCEQPGHPAPKQRL